MIGRKRSPYEGQKGQEIIEKYHINNKKTENHVTKTVEMAKLFAETWNKSADRPKKTIYQFKSVWDDTTFNTARFGILVKTLPGKTIDSVMRFLDPKWESKVQNFQLKRKNGIPVPTTFREKSEIEINPERNAKVINRTKGTYERSFYNKYRAGLIEPHYFHLKKLFSVQTKYKMQNIIQYLFTTNNPEFLRIYEDKRNKKFEEFKNAARNGITPKNAAKKFLYDYESFTKEFLFEIDEIFSGSFDDQILKQNELEGIEYNSFLNSISDKKGSDCNSYLKTNRNKNPTKKYKNHTQMGTTSIPNLKNNNVTSKAKINLGIVTPFALRKQTWKNSQLVKLKKKIGSVKNKVFGKNRKPTKQPKRTSGGRGLTGTVFRAKEQQFRNAKTSVRILESNKANLKLQLNKQKQNAETAKENVQRNAQKRINEEREKSKVDAARRRTLTNYREWWRNKKINELKKKERKSPKPKRTLRKLLGF